MPSVMDEMIARYARVLKHDPQLREFYEALVEFADLTQLSPHASSPFSDTRNAYIGEPSPNVSEEAQAEAARIHASYGGRRTVDALLPHLDDANRAWVEPFLNQPLGEASVQQLLGACLALCYEERIALTEDEIQREIEAAARRYLHSLPLAKLIDYLPEEAAFRLIRALPRHMGELSIAQAFQLFDAPDIQALIARRMRSLPVATLLETLSDAGKAQFEQALRRLFDAFVMQDLLPLSLESLLGRIPEQRLHCAQDMLSLLQEELPVSAIGPALQRHHPDLATLFSKRTMEVEGGLTEKMVELMGYSMSRFLPYVHAQLRARDVAPHLPESLRLHILPQLERLPREYSASDLSMLMGMMGMSRQSVMAAHVLRQGGLTEVPESLKRAAAQRLFGLSEERLERSAIYVYPFSTYDLLTAAVSARTREGQTVLVVPGQHWDGFELFPTVMDVAVRSVPDFDGLEASILTLLEEKGVDAASLGADALAAEARRHIGAVVTAIPVNPTGEMPSLARLERFARTAVRYGLPIVSDEIFASMTHAGTPFVSLGDLTVTVDGVEHDMHARVMRISSNSKTGDAPYENKTAAAISGDRQWVEAIGSPVQFTRMSVEIMEAYLTHTPPSHRDLHGARLAYHAALITKGLAFYNEECGSEIAAWHREPQAGFLGAIRFDEGRLHACGVRTPLDLVGYAVRVAGLAGGIVFADASHPGLLALRINFSDSEGIVDLIKRLGALMESVSRGVSYEEVRAEPAHGRLPPPPRSDAGWDLNFR